MSSSTNRLQVKTGCCGFATRQAEYAKLFGVVEVQQTFYQPPGLATLQRWRETFPPGFEFTLKAWQLITHEAYSGTYRRLKTPLTAQERQDCGSFKDTAIVQQAWETTYNCAQALRARLVLFQCPASFKPTPLNLARMRKFFGSIERGKLQLLWEPRGAWPSELITELCSELNLIYVTDPLVASEADPACFTTIQPSDRRQNLTYYRLHGGKGYRHNFTDAELKALIELISTQPAIETYIMFNNISMLENVQRFQALLDSSLL